jgi:uncharacterized DUF497 family protein
VAIHFEWDDEKAARNLREHGVSFAAARLVFFDPWRITDEDLVVDGEQRWRTIGLADDTAVLLVAHLEGTWGHDLHVRIISARRATPLERAEYEQNRLDDIWHTGE